MCVDDGYAVLVYQFPPPPSRTYFGFVAGSRSPSWLLKKLIWDGSAKEKRASEGREGGKMRGVRDHESEAPPWKKLTLDERKNSYGEEKKGFMRRVLNRL